jgi:glycosyltransferase involved in cell wall biosynthesis
METLDTGGTENIDRDRVAGSPARVLIAIPSFRRPDGLRRLLTEIATMTTGHDIHIVVADNEGEGGAGSAVVRELEGSYRFRLAVVPVPERGLTNVRNALVRYARQNGPFDDIAMIDDDEWPSANWIDDLVAMQQTTGAGIVGGPNLPVFAPGAPGWAKHCPLFRADDMPDGIVDIVWGTCNLLLHKSVFAHSDSNLFDPAFNESGGEDVDAFMRLRKSGHRFAWSRSAVVWEDVPLSRTTLGWITRRAFRIGNSNMLVQLRWKYGRHGRLLAIPSTLAAIGLNLALLFAFSLVAERRLDYYVRLVRSLGKLAFLTGLRSFEYR